MKQPERLRKATSRTRKRNRTGKKTSRTEQGFSTDLEYLEEPLLEFRHGQKLVFPRDGLFLFGPVGDVEQLPTLRYGVIGTKEGVARFRRWSGRIRSLIEVPRPAPGRPAVAPQHVPFPGFREAFHAEWPSEPADLIDDLDAKAIDRALHIGNRHEAIRSTVDIFVNRLIVQNNRQEHPPALWFVVIPEGVYQLGRPRSTVNREERVSGEVKISQARARKLRVEPTLFGIDEEEAEVYQYATHFRRQLKARLLKDRIVTQIIRETTLAPEEFLKENGMPLRRVEDLATIAWKLCTAAYYKSGGRPWQLADVRRGVCYVGLVYKRTDLVTDRRHACCAAQMFLTNGEGVVFRGALGPWFQTDTKQFHLSRDAARDLMQMVIQEYRRLHDSEPEELFVHARSAFSDDEWDGFVEACRGLKTRIVGVQISDGREDLKLFRPGAYPVIRGTTLPFGRRTAFLWTSGYVPRLDTYMGPETESEGVPNLVEN